MGSSHSSGYETDVLSLVATSKDVDEAAAYIASFLGRQPTAYERTQLSKVLEARGTVGDEAVRSGVDRILRYFRVHEVRGEKDVSGMLDLDSVVMQEDDGPGDGHVSTLESPSSEEDLSSSSSVLGGGLPRLNEDGLDPAASGKLTLSQVRVMRHKLKRMAKLH